MMSLTIEQYSEKFLKNKTHANNVQKLSLEIFDEVNGKIKELSDKKRKYLEIASLLHDIGYSISTSKHNQFSQKLIIEKGISGFSDKEIEIISCIARYHRGGKPNKKKHKIYCNLDKKERKTVKRLAGILRIADGLDDRAHSGMIKNIKINYDEENGICTFKLTPYNDDFRPDITFAIRKRELFEIGFKCQTVLVFEI